MILVIVWIIDDGVVVVLKKHVCMESQVVLIYYHKMP